MRGIVVTKKNVAKLYARPDGNIYFKPRSDAITTFELADGFTLEECKIMVKINAEMIFVEGPAKAHVKLCEIELEE